MATRLQNLKRKSEDDSSSDSRTPRKRFRDIHLNEDVDSTSSIPSLDSDDSLEPQDFGYCPELGPNDNPYYLQNMMLYELYVERVKRRVQ
ncbi:uncharacterized protein LOC108137017 [Drosophila elegans]|uniref:uncharacterized protein LOC108137017 n=1 Tax=Drosophila elegans TaxID=30023 RepID=UPI0007E887D1|nr:uncharacterized protein LOC108137017 [Drosophila elegans]